MESFNGKVRDELLARETFYTLTEARIFDRAVAAAVQHRAAALPIHPIHPETKPPENRYENGGVRLDHRAAV